MTYTLSLTVIHKKCKAPMLIEWVVWLKVWTCKKCWERKMLNDLNTVVVNNLIMV
jgi:hypothetical protein